MSTHIQVGAKNRLLNTLSHSQKVPDISQGKVATCLLFKVRRGFFVMTLLQIAAESLSEKVLKSMCIWQYYE